MAHEKKHTITGSFWSGTITFGLVSIQVDLFSTRRPKKTSLRMIDSHGTALHRRYFCPRDHKALKGNEIVRGYEIEEGRFVLVDDEELDRVEPKKSREIDLRSFIEASELDPVYFEHAYYLLPAGAVNKPYRLLAEIMERSGKAGIATFVMRGREHLVAILAEKGILRAQTLRFADEIRSPADIGLPVLEKARPDKAKEMQQAATKILRKDFDPAMLTDRYADRLLDLVGRKLEAGENVVEGKSAENGEGAEIIDLMEIIKKRFQQSGASRGKNVRRTTGAGNSELSSASRQVLYDRAKELDIAGRSTMSKDELIDAIKKAS